MTPITSRRSTARRPAGPVSRVPSRRTTISIAVTSLAAATLVAPHAASAEVSMPSPIQTPLSILGTPPLPGTVVNANYQLTNYENQVNHDMLVFDGQRAVAQQEQFNDNMASLARQTGRPEPIPMHLTAPPVPDPIVEQPIRPITNGMGAQRDIGDPGAGPGENARARATPRPSP